MSTPLDDLLNRLEEVSAEAVRITDPSLNDSALNESAGSIAAFNQIRERGDLIRQLNLALQAAAAPLSYVEFNRLVVIHHQGSRAEENLRRTRNQLGGQLLANNHERAYLDCLTAGAEAPRTDRFTQTG